MSSPFKRIFGLMSVLAMFSLVLTSCHSGSPDKYTDTPTTGSIKISVDETFQPIIDSEIPVFQGIYQYAKVKPIYEPEVDAFNHLFKDSVRMIVVSRGLTIKEREFFANKKFFPKEVKVALDGIAIICNKSNKDTLLTMNQLKQILLGEITNWKQINPKSKLGTLKTVFDNPKSSTVRFAVDSICETNKLGKNLTSFLKNSEVLDFVKKTPNAIGLIGVSWVSDSNDSTALSFLKNVHVMSISRKDVATEENSFQPFQAYINDGRYPLTRSIYIINSEPRTGLATGFTSFIASDRGQKIILKTGILPATQPIRVVKIKED
jgi:phosphate transport system substrate-binding protein